MLQKNIHRKVTLNKKFAFFYFATSGILFSFFLLSLFQVYTFNLSENVFYLLIASMIFALYPSIKSFKFGGTEFATTEIQEDVSILDRQTQREGGPSKKWDLSSYSEIPDSLSLQTEDDPLKSKFGGSSVWNQFRLSATISPIENTQNLHKVSIVVYSLNLNKRLEGKVKFFLHPTFQNPVHIAAFRKMKAVYSVVAYGAFTIGAKIIEENDSITFLELDLNSVNGGKNSFYE